MLTTLRKAQRLLIEANLGPVQGERFQPTGFADLGAATYQRPDGTAMLLVESAQSVANRLEATILGPDNDLIPELAGLSYIRVQMAGASTTTTSSLLEAHRINSPFIISDPEFQQAFKAEAAYSKGAPLNWQRIARALYKYDVNSLLHGAFMANLEDGRIKLARAVSGFIEARDVREVVSGGVKNNPIDPTGKLRAAAYDKDVYSNVPFQRVEYTAAQITAYFNLDLALLRSYDLGDEGYDLLVCLALFKVGRFLGAGLRLRTACDLEVKGPIAVRQPTGIPFPQEAELLPLLKARLAATKGMFADPPVTRLTTQVVLKQGGAAEAREE
ncbi:MAG: type I-U CRISPR-associated RAMP protein Csb1/Cas7u [Candidatus Methylomirabilota bacterium]